MLYAVEHLFGVACSRQGGPQDDNGRNLADGISALSVGPGCARADAVGTVERYRLFHQLRVCMCGYLVVHCSAEAVFTARSNSR